MSVRDRFGRYRDEARHKLKAAFREEHTPHQVGASFALGIFLTALPTGGIGVALFFVFSALWSWISKPALFAAAAVLNPFVKPAVYLSSIHLGSVLLGSEPIRSYETASESAAVTVRQLVVGNVLIAIVLSTVSYLVVRWATRARRQRARRQTESSLLSTISRPFRRE